MIKKKIRIPKDRFIDRKDKIINAFTGSINTSDGLRITAPDYWIHIRSSRTEPLIRIIGEARDKTTIKKYIKKIETILR